VLKKNVAEEPVNAIECVCEFLLVRWIEMVLLFNHVVDVDGFVVACLIFPSTVV
jgi:hypothetical protein